VTVSDSRRRETRLDELTLKVLHRRVSHLTPRYFVALLRVLAFELTDREAPWLTQEAVSILARLLRSSDRGLEFGSGRSTVWFAHRTEHLISVETDRRWYASVQTQLARYGLSDRVDYRWIPADESLSDDRYRTPYLSTADDLPADVLDYVLVDGVYRADCAVRAVRLVKPGGLLVVDNINWFIGNNSRSPLSVRGVQSPSWERFSGLVRTWRLIWTTSGVTDTGIWIRTD
jgi:predicted O-methyltransferase YrrM